MKRSFLFIFILLGTSLYGQNNPPVAVQDTSETMSQVPVEIDILQNDHDPDGDNFTISYLGHPYHGTVDTLDNVVTYVSEAFRGWDRFSYRIQDDGVDPMTSYMATVWVHVTENPNAPVAVKDTFEVLKLVPVQLDIMANDYDLNGDPMKILYETASSVTIDPDSNTVTVIPSYHNEVGTSFMYKIIERSTPEQYESEWTNVTLVKLENPDMPVAVNDQAETTGGFPVQVSVMENDYDPQGEEIELYNRGHVYHGTVTIIGDDILYQPEISFTGTDSVNYYIRETADTNIYSYPAWVYFDIAKNPGCPVALPDEASGTTYVEMTIDVLANDYDNNGDLFEIWEVRGNLGASIAISDDMVVYTSSPVSIGSDSLFYRIRETGDPEYYSEWTPVYIDLEVNPDLPVAVDDYIETTAGIPVTFDPLQNDIFNSEDNLSLILSESYSHKGKSYYIDSAVTYIPYMRSKGRDSLLYVLASYNPFAILAKGLIYIDIIDQHYYDSLDVNNINAGVNASGTLFSRIEEIPSHDILRDQKPHFRYPKNTVKNTIFNTHLWIGGLDENDSLHLAGQRYKIKGFDYHSGPVSDDYNEGHYLRYGRTWKISRTEIEHHRNNYWKEGYEPIDPIASWPGNGNPAHGEPLLLARFQDMDNDGIYDPVAGDYPLIRGDQSIFFMFNDDRVHGETEGGAMKVEVHAMAYGYDEPEDTALHNTVFIHFDLYNRSEHTYHDTYVGFFTDFSLGYAWDDYVGSDVERGTFYVYNGEEVDGDGEPGSYGQDPPAQSVTVLAGPFMDPDGLDNPDGGCDESVNGLNFGNGILDDERSGLRSFMYFNSGGNAYTSDPSDSEEYYSYLGAFWLDGTPLMYGGNGHPFAGSVGPECRYMFPGASDPMNWGTYCVLPNEGYNQDGKYWTDAETGNHPYDRRGLGAMGPFTFSPDIVQEIEMAFVVGQGNNGPLSSVDQMMRQIDSLIAGVRNGRIIVPNQYLSVSENETEQPVLGIYPNPSREMINIRLAGYGNNLCTYMIYNMQGISVDSGKLLSGGQTIHHISDYPAGIYLLVLYTGTQTVTGRFLKL